MPLSAAEQYFLELLNRARLDPRGAAARQETGLNEGLGPGTIDGSAKAALAPSEALHDSSAAHSAWMLRTDVFSHAGQGGSKAGDRMEDAGYAFRGSWAWGENLALHTVDGRSAARLAELHHRGLWNSPGHRQNLLSDDFREVGIADVHGTFDFGGASRQTSIITNNFARSGDRFFVTGVVYDDRDDDGFYTVGEGQGGVRFSAGGRSDTSEAAGGYALRVDGGGTVDVAIDGRGIDAEIRVDLSDGNAKIDVVDGDWIFSSVDLELGTGARKAGLLAAGNLDLVGNGAGNRLKGNDGRNEIDGRGGADTITGFRGNDRIDGGGGDDRLWGGAGNDRLRGEAGNDRIGGQFGDDRLFGGDGDDVLMGGTGRDHLFGGRGDDKLFGFRGDDKLFGGAGQDRLFGGPMNDQLFGGGEDDRLFGGTGNDLIAGLGGIDRVNGGPGADRFVHRGTAAERHDVIRDYNAAEGDRFVFRGDADNAGDFAVSFANTYGDPGQRDARITHKDTGQLLWVVVDAQGQGDLDVVLPGDGVFDLLA